ncbi:MAG: succinate dehydrogenase, cytochrome b556 subunit [Candidatus Pelagibacter sp.]|nr:succinate dehydrogenase, cytochrome b556 subunit [Candidatus Pelagibacter sp.]|tara:strand:+ start:921 stop:1304 length:384 start_codon:yes stop_codon:yes gene_type:complete
MENKNPLSPHIQIYSWHISSLVSIGHRITGIINIVILTIITFWIGSLMLGETLYQVIFNFMNSFFGKFIIIGTIWSFTFHSLSELRHLFWDMGYGFELKTANLTGALVIIFSIIFTVIIYIMGRIFL